MSSDEEAVVCATIAILARLRTKKQKKNQRRLWVHPIFLETMRKGQGIHDNLISELRVNDPSKFFNYLRMSPESFDKLLSFVGPLIVKEDSRFRSAINPSTRLALTLR